MHLVSLGDLSLDIVIGVGSEIATGSDVGGSIAFRVGGSAANVARSFATLGGHGSASFVGAVGDDVLGRRLPRELRRDGVVPRLAVVEGRATARIAVLLGQGGQRSFVTSRGAADCLAPAAMRREWFRHASVLHLPAYSLLTAPLADAARLAAEWVHGYGGLVSVDLASAEPLRAAGPGAARLAVESVRPDILFANADEVAAVDGIDGMAPVSVIKHGAAGCDVNGLHVATERLEPTDTTGAGDAFDAGFLWSWLTEPGNGAAAGAAGNRAATALLTSVRREIVLR